MTYELTIGQAARFAGVTVKTVRHYHRLGLVAEPGRDNSGYRRYDSAGLLRLVQVRTLAQAGVPLAEIGTMLDADADEFADAVARVSAQMEERIQTLVERRRMLEELAYGDRMLLPVRAREVLDRMATLGLPSDYVAAQREGLVLFRALMPGHFDAFVGQLESRVADAWYVELTKRSWEAASWDPDDPRLDGLAAALADNLLTHIDRANPMGLDAGADSRTRYDLMNRHREHELPAIARLTVLIEERLRAAGIDVPRG